jgi:hypothetical protein
LRNHKTSEDKQVRRGKYRQENHKTLEEGAKKKKNINNSKIKVGGIYSSNR